MDNYEVIDGIPTFTLGINRADFPDEETYLRAKATSEAPRDYSANGSLQRIPADRLVEVIVALVNGARAVGLGVLHDADITPEEVERLLAQDYAYYEGKARPVEHSFDYVNGRPIKMTFVQQPEGSFEVETRLYNRDQYAGKAERIIQGVLG